MVCICFFLTILEVNIVQQYQLFPHQRYEDFLSAVNHMKGISSHLNEVNCSDKNCITKSYHGVKKTLQSECKVGNIVVDRLYPTKAAGSNTETRSQRLDATVSDSDSGDFFKGVESKLQKLNDRLVNDISRDVFDESDIETITNTKTVLDVRQIKIERQSYNLSADIHAERYFPKYSNAVKQLWVPFLDVISENIILTQFKKFLSIIEAQLKDKSDDELKEYDSRELFQDLFNTKDERSKSVQVILHISACAATKVSCESVLETFVSEYEYANNSRKNYSEQGMNEVFNIVKKMVLQLRSVIRL